MLELFKTRRHLKHRVHPNSRRSWEEARQELPKRKRIVIDAFISGGAATDRDIMKRTAFTEPNMVRPSISALLKDDMLVEVGTTKCKVTGKRVRIVDLPKAVKI